MKSKWVEIRDSIEDFFTHTVWDFLKPFAAVIKSEGSQILIIAAENAVKAGFTADGSGETKMATALASFSAEVVDKGAPFVESQARALIEVALQNAKATPPDNTPSA